MSLFASVPDSHATRDRSRPLADRMRPASLDEFVGQEHILSPGKPLRLQIERDDPGSIIFWGPLGTGKTTLAKIIARVTKADFLEFSAVLAGIKEINQVMSDAQKARDMGTRTILFVDEIHRFNKAQQDAFLPYIENGTLFLIGATAENLSFYLNAALLSRLRVLPLYPLDPLALEPLLKRYEKLFGQLPITEEARQLIILWAQGDGRYLYNLIENFQDSPEEILNEQNLKLILQKKTALFDKASDQHYNLISALHKSVRGSDPDA